MPVAFARRRTAAHCRWRWRPGCRATAAAPLPPPSTRAAPGCRRRARRSPGRRQRARRGAEREALAILVEQPQARGAAAEQLDGGADDALEDLVAGECR